MNSFFYRETYTFIGDLMWHKYSFIFFIAFSISLFFLQIVDAELKPKQTLYQKIITIDPGHGGRDSGTIYGKIYEKDLNLEISKILKTELEKYGAIVYLIREDDSDLSSQWDKQKKRGDLYRRILFIQNKKSDLYLSVHINSGNGTGQEVLYHPINQNNIILAESIQKYFEQDLKTKRVIKKTNLYLYSNTRVPGVLIECGFLSNSNDRYLLQKESYQQKIAESIRKGVEEYFSTIDLE